MGRITKNAGDLENGDLFDDLGVSRKPKSVDPAVGSPPPWSVEKARLVEEYIINYQRITRGGFYIDGFAAPQRLEHEDELWTVKRILEVEPKRIRRFWLADLNPEGVKRLRVLKAKHNKKPRTVTVHQGDFNKIVDLVLGTGRIRGRSSCFAFLDQRTTECHWATVKKLADWRPKRKIELLYFFPSGWITRTLKSTTTPEGIRDINLWWGRETWAEELLGRNQLQQTEIMQERFSKELGYPYVRSFPIFRDKNDQRRLYYLIHASAHPEANKLMQRAYSKIVGARSGTPGDSQITMPF